MSKSLKQKWFIKTRGSYLPVSWQGWMVYVPYIFWLFVSYLVLSQNDISVANMLVIIVPCWVSGAVVMHWIAAQKS